MCCSLVTVVLHTGLVTVVLHTGQWVIVVLSYDLCR